MAFMHSSEFLHRDLKSQNILLALGWTRGAAGTDVEHLQAKVFAAWVQLCIIAIEGRCCRDG